MDFKNIVKNNKGFTIVEMILVTAVLAAVVSIAFPDFVRFFQMREEANEDLAMKEIKRSLESYADQNSALPDVATWSTQLAPFSSLSESAILKDMWGRTRQYQKITETITFRSASIDVDYAVVYGYGIGDGTDSNAASPVYLNLATAVTDVAEYSAMEPALDDYMIKYTNYKQQIENYEATEQRLRDISSALSNYATTLFNESVIAGTPNAEQLIYYPPSNGGDGTPADLNLYYAKSKSDIFDISGGSITSVSVSANDVTRQESMEVLMRVLGLPATHCCEALTPTKRPFFYYSNPLARNAAGSCIGSRPTAAERKLPPRVSVEADICG